MSLSGEGLPNPSILWMQIPWMQTPRDADPSHLNIVNNLYQPKQNFNSRMSSYNDIFGILFVLSTTVCISLLLKNS